MSEKLKMFTSLQVHCSLAKIKFIYYKNFLNPKAKRFVINRNLHDQQKKVAYFFIFIIFFKLMNKHFQKILLVDDDSVSNFLNEMALQDMNLSDEVHVSENGEEALDFINKQCRNGSVSNCPDLIFLDINMPIMDGFQFLEALEKVPDLNKKPIKIVMLTSSNANKDLERAKKFNIDGYIVKPLSEEKLNAVFA